MCCDDMIGIDEMLKLFYEKQILQEAGECDEDYFEIPIRLTEIKTWNSTGGKEDGSNN